MEGRYIDSLIERCKDAMEGRLDVNQANALGREIDGAFRGRSVYGRIATNAGYRNWSEVLGGLLLYRDDMDREMEKAKAQSQSVNAFASATSETSIDMTVSLAIRSVMKIEGLSAEDKAHAADLLNAADSEEDGTKKASKVIDALKWAIEKGGPSLAAMAPALGQILQNLGL